ncbi:hypothetical protein PAEPH01_0561 [Pancytospora epiphaga]|nr:hypothetical protein PAEPH01_0561 [Pancytospora epiphaga]
MKEVEKFFNLVVLYTTPPMPQCVSRTEIPSKRNVVGGYFEKIMTGLLESVVKNIPNDKIDKDSNGVIAESIDNGVIAESIDVKMNDIDVLQSIKNPDSIKGKKNRRKKPKAETSKISGKSQIDFKKKFDSTANDLNGSTNGKPAEEKVVSALRSFKILSNRRRILGSVDDNNISQDWFIQIPDPAKTVTRILGWYNLSADVSVYTEKPVPPPIISGILRLGSDTRVVSTNSISVDIVSDKFRFCKNKVVDKIQVNLRDIRNSIPQKQPNKWGLIFSRSFNIYDFCNDNRFVSLSIIAGHLQLLEIEPSLFMKSRILGFYNQDVDAISLARDISYYTILYGRAGLQLAHLSLYIEDLIADQSCDAGHLELYCVIKTLKIIEEPSVATQKENGSDTNGHICIYNDHISIGGVNINSSLSCKIISSLQLVLRTHKGYGRIRALYIAVSKYQSINIHLSFSVVEQLFKIEYISRRDVIAAVSLIERLRMVVPQSVVNTYKEAMKSIATSFCNALNATLKRKESSNLYEIIRGLITSVEGKRGDGETLGRSNTGKETSGMSVGRRSPCDGYASERFIREISEVYIRRIRKVENICDLEPIYDSILQFNELFGVVWSIEAELVRAVRMRAVRDASGWPSGRFAEKIKQILNG